MISDMLASFLPLSSIDLKCVGMECGSYICAPLHSVITLSEYYFLGQLSSRLKGIIKAFILIISIWKSNLLSDSI
jgi:hypothetical protein